MPDDNSINGWYYHNMVCFCLENNIITLDNIKYVVESSALICHCPTAGPDSGSRWSSRASVFVVRILSVPSVRQLFWQPRHVCSCRGCGAGIGKRAQVGPIGVLCQNYYERTSGEPRPTGVLCQNYYEIVVPGAKPCCPPPGST
jgi:hypothetical protein